MVGHNRLSTLDWLVKYGVAQSQQCLLCKLEDESHNHLFFEFDFSKFVWHNILVKCLIHRRSFKWCNELDRLAWTQSSSSLKSTVRRWSLATVVYHVWRERNGRWMLNQLKDKQSILNDCVANIKIKLASLKNVTNTPFNRDLFEAWGRVPFSVWTSRLFFVCSCFCLFSAYWAILVRAGLLSCHLI